MGLTTIDRREGWVASTLRGKRRPGRWRGRWRLVAAAAAGAAPVVFIGWILGASPGGPAAKPAVEQPRAGAHTEGEESQLTGEDDALQVDAAEFAALVREVALAAGSIIELEMKPGIGDIREEAFEDDILRGFSDRWAGDLGGLRDGLASARIPVGLGESHRLYVDALDGYREVAVLLSQAVEVPLDEREAALQRAIELGVATDRVWNRAQELLADHLRHLGLDPSRWLPVSTA